MFKTAGRELSLRRNSLILLSMIALTLAAIYTSIYPAIHAQAAQLLHAFGNIYKYLGIDRSVSFNSLQGWISTEMFAVSWPILITILTASLSGGALAGEIETGSLGMLLALPISRIRIYLAKYLAGASAIIAFIIASVFSVCLLALALNISFNFAHFLVTGLLCLLLGLAVFSLGLMASAFLNDKSHLYGLIGGVMLIMYVFNTIAGIKQSLHLLKYFSFFHYFDANAALSYGHISLTNVLLFLSIIVSCSLIGLIWFKRRDISI